MASEDNSGYKKQQGDLSVRHEVHIENNLRMTTRERVCLLLGILLVIGLINPLVVQAKALPDLVITDISIDSECRLAVTVQNAGKGALPRSAYQEPGGASISFFKDNASFGGWGISTIDPQQQLKNPGASVTWLRPSPKISGTAMIRVAADEPRNVVAESNEGNNSLSRNFTCTPTLPDVRISQVNFTSDCRAQLVMENIGDAPLPNSVLTSSGGYLQRYLDGELAGQVRLDLLDPAAAMQPPGGVKTWTDGSQYRASNSVKYQLRKLGQEWNSANNTFEAPVPSRCQVAVQGPPDLEVTDISLNSDCRLVMTLTNNGPGPMPQSAYDPIGSPSVNFYRDGAAFGGWSLNTFDPQQTMTTPGTSVTWVRQNPQLSGSVEIRTVIDIAQELTESNETNNETIRTVSCGGSTPEPEPDTGTPAPAESAGSANPPDLAITGITYSRDCKPILRLGNLGGPLNERVYRGKGITLQRFENNRPRSTRSIPLVTIDRQHRLLSGGSVSWTDNSVSPSAKSLRYQLAGVGAETNTGNNAKTVNVPARCLTAPKIRVKPRPIDRVQPGVPLKK
jgi:hypothetical protein